MITKPMRLDKGAWIKGAIAAAVMSAGMSYVVTYFSGWHAGPAGGECGQ